MPKKRISLTPDLQNTITAYIRAGAFQHTAAAAAGVPSATFDHWMKLGRRARAAERYRLFVAAVDMATAQARVAAELAVHSDDPRTWLTKGPGKETPGNPGWSGVVKPIISVDNRSVNLLADPNAAAMLQLLLAALAPFPEARKAAIQALNTQPAIEHRPVEVVDVGKPVDVVDVVEVVDVVDVGKPAKP